MSPVAKTAGAALSPSPGVTAPSAGPTLQPPGDEMPTTTGSSNWTTTRSNAEVALELEEIAIGTVFNIPNNFREIRGA
jgi:hypothetical protein